MEFDSLTSFSSGVVLTLTEFVGDYGAKIQSPLLAYSGYNLLSYELIGMLKNNPLSLVNAYWDGISNLMTLALGYFLGERLSDSQYFGAFLISAGLLLLQDGKQN